MSRWIEALIAALQAIFKPKPPPPVVVPPVEPEPPPPPEQPDSPWFLWKPVSENDKLLVVVTPSYRDFKTLKVKGEFGFLAGRGNGNRQAWRFKRPGKAYGALVKVVGTEANGLEVQWIVPNVAVRWESR